MRTRALRSEATPETLEKFRGRIVLWLLPLGSIASIIPWFVERQANDISDLDLYTLPVMAVIFLGLAIWLWLRPKQIDLVILAVLVVLASYELADFSLIALPTIHQANAGGPGLPWFPFVMMLSFFVFPENWAIRFSALYAAIALIIGLISFSSGINSRQFNVMLQFYLANTTSLGMLWILGRFRQSYSRMHQIAHTDSLTGIVNRRSMQIKLERALSSGMSFGVLLADVDHFKRINDQYGHAMGDQVLRELAFVLENYTRQSDIVSRWGGEEFLILAPVVNLEHAGLLAERLLKGVRAANVAGLHPTVSVGVAYHAPNEPLEQVIARADRALYQAKTNGRDRVVIDDEAKISSVID